MYGNLVNTDYSYFDTDGKSKLQTQTSDGERFVLSNYKWGSYVKSSII